MAEQAVAETVRTITIPPTFTTLVDESPVSVVIAGCGGIGARLAPMVVKLLRRGDSLTLLDHDIVEMKNLARQHFTGRQVGMYKAEAVAASIASEAARLGVDLQPKVHKLDGAERLGPSRNLIVLSGFDNREARLHLKQSIDAYHRHATAWIDGGNERRGGQVMLSLTGYGMKRALLPNAAYAPTTADAGEVLLVTVPTLELALPELLRPEGLQLPVAERAVGCWQIDDQTLAANALAATYMVTMFSWLRYEIPFSTVGVYFSTLGSTRPIVAGNYVAVGYRSLRFGLGTL